MSNKNLTEAEVIRLSELADKLLDRTATEAEAEEYFKLKEKAEEKKKIS